MNQSDKRTVKNEEEEKSLGIYTSDREFVPTWWTCSLISSCKDVPSRVRKEDYNVVCVIIPFSQLPHGLQHEILGIC